MLHTFAGAPNDGYGAVGTPVIDKAGNLYGTTFRGGLHDLGTVYKLSPVMKTKGKGTWTKKILRSFNVGDHGFDPVAGVVLDAVGNIYGTTVGGSKDGQGSGTVFELVAPVGTSRYKERVLWNFNGVDGTVPHSKLIFDSAGNLYGTTYQGGSGGGGVVFEVTP